MNYNYNPYQMYGNMYPQQMNFQPQPQGQPRQRAFAEYLLVNSVDEVKNYIMNANSTIIFKDVNAKIIYEKKADSQGLSEIKAYQEIDMNAKQQPNQYVTFEALNSVINDFNTKINYLSQEIGKSNTKPNNPFRAKMEEEVE